MTRQKRRDPMKPLVLTLSARSSTKAYWDGCCLMGRAKANGELARVTDEKPARDSAGRCGPVD